ncbi:VOC family protein [Nocardioides sp. Kera G14]|uniref:VOC family protein n=1 Tax=Nocardioides sp. Kera G14 TaxID=2884264 RepID=UPI001D125AD8|nr:VOC family protein [Nocardioides sp. Kera G14]UDY24603.1 hypothetical protein LH076_04670 [Nocardioides sp. Kera G14]
MEITWLTATIDLPDETFGQGKAFWGAVTGYRPNLPPFNDPNYAVLQPQVGTPHLWLQRLGSDDEADPRVHLDVSVTDLSAAVSHAQSVGARLVTRTSHAIMESPGHVPFCLIPRDSSQEAPEPAPPVAWPGGRSRVDQACLDIGSAEDWESEVAFWGALTGWRIDADDQWARLWTPSSWPLRVLLQRRLEGDSTAHLDVSAEDCPAEIARWEALGARTVGEGPRWTVLDTPGGLTACLTQREPDSGLLTGAVPPDAI